MSQNAIWVAKIWKIDMNTGSTTEVASSQGKDIRLDSWNEIEFEEPYHINGDETLLIGYEFYGAGNAMGIDQGPCKTGRGDWANFGQGWITLQSAVSNFNYNNLIHVYMENTGEPSANGPRVVPAGKTQPVLSGVRADVTMSELSVGKGQSEPTIRSSYQALKVSTQRDICSTASMSRTRRMNPDGHNSTPLLFPRLSSPTSTGRMWPRVRTAGRSRRSTPPAIPNLNSVSNPITRMVR